MRIMGNKNKNSSYFGGVQYAEIRRGDIGRRNGAAAASHGGAGVPGDEKEHPSIALGTVYKHLNGLAEEGLLLRITEPGSPDRYDRTERHDHLICSRCGKITDVRLPDMQERIREALGQEILSYDLRIRYICPACREQEKDNIMEEKHHER